MCSQKGAAPAGAAAGDAALAALELQLMPKVKAGKAAEAAGDLCVDTQSGPCL